MSKDYEKIKNTIKNALSDSFSTTMKDYSKKWDGFVKKVVEKGDSVDVDFTKLIGLLQGLRFMKTKKSGKTKKLVLSLTIASIIALGLGLTIKSYDKIKEGRNVEEKIKIFIESLELDKLKDNPTIKKVRKELKSLL